MANESQLRASEIKGVLLSEIERYEEDLHAEPLRPVEGSRLIFRRTDGRLAKLTLDEKERLRLRCEVCKIRFMRVHTSVGSLLRSQG